MSTFIYVQSVDSGVAPCVEAGVWSLALCKPTIRRTACKGDTVIAVTQAEDGHRLSSWAKVAERISTAEFFERFPKTRLDNIYRPKLRGEGYIRHDEVKHVAHNRPEDLLHDVGACGEKGFALVSEDFYSFGRNAIPVDEWTSGLKTLRSVVNALARATRRYFAEGVKNDLLKLEERLRATYPTRHNEDFVPRDPLAEDRESETNGSVYTICNPSRKRVQRKCGRF